MGDNDIPEKSSSLSEKDTKSMIFKANNTDKTTSNRATKRKYGGKTNFVLVLILCIVCLIFFCGKDESSKSKENSQRIPPPQKKESHEPEIVIQRILLQPSQPTRRDTITAEIFLSESAKASGKSFQYIYAWKVNNQPVPYVSGNTLQLSDFNIDDSVTVTVTPYDEGVAAPAQVSQPLKIHAVPPSLDLQFTQDKFTAGESFECQLISKHPESETVTFSLEEPKIEGMTINAKTGRITWSIPTAQKKTLQFGASVIDPEGRKTTKTFTVDINHDASASTDTK